MRSACFIGMTAVLVALSGCDSDEVDFPGGTTTTSTGQGGEGGSGTTTTTTTTTTTGEGGAGQGGNGQGGEGGTMTCPGLGDECTNCLSAECQQTYCACFNNSECVQLAQCLQACDAGDDACQQACLEDHPEGIGDSLLVSDCTAANCNAECPGAGQELTPCVECLLTQCSMQMDACFADPECLELITCVQACALDDEPCQQGCAAANPGGIGEAQVVFECADDQCNMGQCNQP